MRNILFCLLLFALCGCATHQIEYETQNLLNDESCVGNTNLPENIASNFEQVEDLQLLSKSLGTSKKGKLCQGQVYKSKENSNIIIYRAWNSTNPNSKLGKWWAFTVPSGKISTYRAEYEICYQWSPLDKLVSCTLKPNMKIVVGTGQSAECSEYLTYNVSDKKQIYIEDASSSLTNCTILDGVFTWK